MRRTVVRYVRVLRVWMCVDVCGYVDVGIDVKKRCLRFFYYFYKNAFLMVFYFLESFFIF